MFDRLYSRSTCTLCLYVALRLQVTTFLSCHWLWDKVGGIWAPVRANHMNGTIGWSHVSDLLLVIPTVRYWQTYYCECNIVLVWLESYFVVLYAVLLILLLGACWHCSDICKRVNMCAIHVVFFYHYKLVNCIRGTAALACYVTLVIIEDHLLAADSLTVMCQSGNMRGDTCYPVCNKLQLHFRRPSVWSCLPALNRLDFSSLTGDWKHESLSERPAELVVDGVRHRDGKHRAEFQRPQLFVREALHGHARVWWDMTARQSIIIMSPWFF